MRLKLSVKRGNDPMREVVVTADVTATITDELTDRSVRSVAASIEQIYRNAPSPLHIDSQGNIVTDFYAVRGK